MINQELAQIFNNMAAYCEMSGEKNAFFRSRAFKKAAEFIDKFPYNLSEPEWQDLKKLIELDGIGKGIALHIIEYVQTGVIKDYENMKAESPVKLEELLKVQGVGPKTILTLYKKLHVTDLETLEKAARENKIAELDGFGEKKQQNIIESIEFAIRNKDRIPLYLVRNQIDEILAYLKTDKNLIRVEAAGSYRRCLETIGDVDLLAASKKREETMKHFVEYKNVEKILGQGDTKGSIWLKSKLQVDMRIIDEKSFGSALQYFTGNKDHNVKLRQLAINKGFKLSEYGLFDRDSGKSLESKNEEKVYEKILGVYIVPEMRENLGEIEAAEQNKLPNLITQKDIHGDMHMHTVMSDGKNTASEMAKECAKLGYKYMGISDHFGKLKIAGAIDSSEFKDYLETIRKADDENDNIMIFASGEVDIDKDGNLEFEDKYLNELDYVIVAAHLGNKMTKIEMTRRIITALKHPKVKILAHPTGRLIGQRPGFEFDYKEIFKVAKNEDVALEINAHPMRLDLPWALVKLAVDIGCKIVINTDSHAIEELKNMHYGVSMARKGWVTKNNLWTPSLV